MKYFYIILAFLLCFSSLELHAQRYPKSEKEANLEAKASTSELYQKNSSIWLAGNKLSKKELAAMEGFDINLYSKGRTKAAVGTTLISIGAVPCAFGVIGLVETIQESIRINKVTNAGLYPIPGNGLPEVVMLLGLGTGLLLEAIGIPMLVSGKADIRHAAVGYNGGQRQVSIGPSTSGLGLALYF